MNAPEVTTLISSAERRARGQKPQQTESSIRLWCGIEFFSYGLSFPFSTAECKEGNDREGGIGDRDGREDSVRPATRRKCHEPGKGKLPSPEANEVQNGGGHGLARTVERLHQHHAPGVEDKTVGHDAKGARGQGSHLRVGGEDSQKWFREDDEDLPPRSLEKTML